MNEQVLKEVVPGDLTQRVRNTISKWTSSDDKDVLYLKKEINNFLWMHLPGKTTIRQAEMIGCKIFSMMVDTG